MLLERLLFAEYYSKHFTCNKSFNSFHPMDLTLKIRQSKNDTVYSLVLSHAATEWQRHLCQNQAQRRARQDAVLNQAVAPGITVPCFGALSANWSASFFLLSSPSGAACQSGPSLRSTSQLSYAPPFFWQENSPMM